jgi:hypothetical protein
MKNDSNKGDTGKPNLIRRLNKSVKTEVFTTEVLNISERFLLLCWIQMCNLRYTVLSRKGF